ncbi:uncharacterized protein EDB91DRAFT_1082214 [Suillus paluster]|uniref:uncharacterized protein n=1 Tax=Suillus paluster TaxID=48578 RepID=UPI001B86FB74|nr:uncharacterized protein EDB91DRAFT_1082214 [Suillus paluster]KAG1739833.1 hypothetical protein EDB91DRAFT_1082214 [Suillus paluster]
MATSSNPTEQNWHPSSLLPYDALPNHHDDFDSMVFNAKSTAGTGTNFTTALLLHHYRGFHYSNSGSFLGGTGDGTVLSAEALTLILDLLVTICTEFTGFVHGISLRSALASESRLPFNTNLRLLTAACGWRNPNGALLNGIMAVLIISYTSTSLILYDDFTVKDDTDIVMDIAIAGLPLLFLGVALLLQVVIALSGMRAVKILTWSSSPFDLTAALVHHSRLIPVPFQCIMRWMDSARHLFSEDAWAPVMWWGHKGDGIPYCYAGTSDHPLPDVKMDCVYAGSGVDSPAIVP